MIAILKTTLFFVVLFLCPIESFYAQSTTPQSHENASLTNEPDDPSKIMFTPPSGWRFADSTNLPPHVQVMVVGKGKNNYPPSINLTTERYSGTLKEYLKIVKRINDSQNTPWKDLGTIQTEAGTASLSQIDLKTEWGDVRMMHLILAKDGIIYLLTAASIKEEFPKFYTEFFKAMRSLRFTKEASLKTP